MLFALSNVVVSLCPLRIRHVHFITAISISLRKQNPLLNVLDKVHYLLGIVNPDAYFALRRETDVRSTNDTTLGANKCCWDVYEHIYVFFIVWSVGT